MLLFFIAVEMLERAGSPAVTDEENEIGPASYAAN